MSRISLPQKDYDRLKRTTEQITLKCGGSFRDETGGKFIKSTYTHKEKLFRVDWHTSYSSKRSLTNIKSQLRKSFEDWGIERRELRKQKGFHFFTGQIEELVLLNFYEFMDRKLSFLDDGEGDE